MKKNLFLFLTLSLFFLFPLCVRADYVPDGTEIVLDENNFPDAAFRTLLRNRYAIRVMTDGERYYFQTSQGPIPSFTLTDNNEIVSLKGLELLNVDNSVIISGCSSLESLDLSNQQGIKTVDIRNCSSLKQIDVRNCHALTNLFAQDNASLKMLYADGCTSLENLRPFNNSLEILSFDECPSLSSLDCDRNQLTSLDVNHCKKLTGLSCFQNNLTELSFRDLPLLSGVTCSSNQLVRLSVSGCPSLQSLNAFKNQLKEFKAEGCGSLKKLDLELNRLSTVDLTSLENLECLLIGPSSNYNDLERLDISMCPVLCDYVKGERNVVRRVNEYGVSYRDTTTNGSRLTYGLNTELIYDKGTIPAGTGETVEKTGQAINAANKTVAAGSVVSLGASAKTKLTYTSSDKKTATVTADGKVKGINPGKATITITAAETQAYKPASKKITITVYAAKGKTYTVGKLKYKVTNASVSGKGAVTLTLPVSKVLYKINVPSTVRIGTESYKVTAIGAKAFQKNVKLTTVTIGANVKTIGAFAFAGDTKLRKVTIVSKMIKTVGQKAFYGIYRKAVFNVPAAKKKAYTTLFKKAGMPAGVVVK